MTNYYLSRVDLNARRQGARKLMLSPQAMHAAVESSLPPSARVPGERFLWRLDTSGVRNELFVVSPGEPDFTHIVEQAGWATSDTKGWVSRPYNRLLDRLAEGQLWAFRLAANPVRMGKAPDGKRQRFGHVTAVQQLEWILKRCEPNGFEIPLETGGEPALELIDRGTLRFRRAPNSPPVTITKAVYEGVLRVKDPQLLRDALVRGIGRARAYGCGLMTLAPIGTAG